MFESPGATYLDGENLHQFSVVTRALNCIHKSSDSIYRWITKEIEELIESIYPEALRFAQRPILFCSCLSVLMCDMVS